VQFKYRVRMCSSHFYGNAFLLIVSSFKLLRLRESGDQISSFS